MPKYMTRARPRFIQQAKMRRAIANGDDRGKSTQSKGVRLSLDGSRFIMNRNERRWTAYHEAGHAVINALLGIRFRLVTIIPSGELLGRVERQQLPIGRRRWKRIPRGYVRREIVSALAGGIAEGLARRDGLASGLRDDLEKLVSLIRLLPRSRTLSGRCRCHIEMHRRAEGLVRRNWDVIDEVARKLIRDKTLSEREVLKVLRDYCRYRHQIEVMLEWVRRAQHSGGLLPNAERLRSRHVQVR